MIALLILLGLMLYIAFAVLIVIWVRRAFTTSRAKSLAMVGLLVMLVLIPTADEFVGKWYFDHLCDSEPRVTIYKSVEQVEGILNPGMPFGELEKLGYKFREHESSGKYYHSGRDSSGKETDEEIPSPTAKYVVKGKTWDEVRFNVKKWEEVIVNAQTGETLARYTTFSYGGGWISRVLKSFGLPGGGMCQPSMSGYKDFYVDTLKPVKS